MADLRYFCEHCFGPSDLCVHPPALSRLEDFLQVADDFAHAGTATVGGATGGGPRGGR